MANGVTTEWDDLQVKYGNYEPLVKEKSQAEYTKEIIDKLEQRDPLENKNKDELDSLEDDYDDEFLNQYKQKRIQEMQEQSKLPHFGYLLEISRDEYVAHVTNAPKSTFVVLHLYQTYIEKSELMNQYLSQLAIKYPRTKFIKMIATRCIEKFPDSQLPCIIVYKDGGCRQNISNVDQVLLKFSLHNVEKLFSAWGVIDNKEILQEEDEMTQFQRITKGKLGFRNKDSDNDDDDDREYISNQIKK